MTRTEEQQPQRDEHELDPETVEDLEPQGEEAGKARGGGGSRTCHEVPAIQRPGA